MGSPVLAKKKVEPTPFGRALRERREAAGLSLADLAEMIGVQKSSLRRLEVSPTANPTISTVRAIAAALGCSVADLVSPA